MKVNGKWAQIEPSIMDVCGVTISSRYGSPSEIATMIQFVGKAFEIEAAHHLKSVFFDTKGGVVNIEFNDKFVNGSPNGVALKQIAEHYFGYFIWGESGEIYYSPDYEHLGDRFMRIMEPSLN